MRITHRYSSEHYQYAAYVLYDYENNAWAYVDHKGLHFNDENVTWYDTKEEALSCVEGYPQFQIVMKEKDEPKIHHDITAPVEIEYDESVDAAYMHFQDKGTASHRQSEVSLPGGGVSIIMDFDEDDRIVGMEILGASNILPKDFIPWKHGMF